MSTTKNSYKEYSPIILSLIIPVYKVEKYIEYCLNSIFSQKIPEYLYEVIVVNDGTPDNSMSIVKKFSNHQNLIIINQENQGLSIARNNGMEQAKGEYIWFIDSDDWLLPNAINTIIEEIRNNAPIDVFSTRLLMTFENTKKTKIDFNPDCYTLTGKEYLTKKYNIGASQRFIIRKRFLNKNKITFYPQILHEDGVFGYMMLYLAQNVKILKEPVYAYRLRQEGSIMSSISVKSCYDLIKGHKILKEFMNVRVDPQEQTWYQIQIFSMISSCFIIAKKIISTPQFIDFYHKNKSYIKLEAQIMSKSDWNFFRYLFLKTSPYYYYKIRNSIIKVILRLKK